MLILKLYWLLLWKYFHIHTITDTEIVTHDTVDKFMFSHRSLNQALYKFFSTGEY